MLFRRAAFTALVLFTSAVSASAQETSETGPTLESRSIVTMVAAPSGESPVQILNSLERWTRDYDEWSAWFAQWRNRREPGWWSSRERRVPPEPPVWLPVACEGAGEDIEPLADACRALRESRRDLEDEAAAVAAQKIAQNRSQLESPTKTAWWSRIHLDAIWPMTRSGSSAYGLFGVHATLPIAGRFQVFLAPGAIVMRLPSIDGNSTLTTATDWGFSVRLGDFKIPGLHRANTVHFNMARVWLLGTPSMVQMPGDLYVAGFSLTFKDR